MGKKGKKNNNKKQNEQAQTQTQEQTATQHAENTVQGEENPFGNVSQEDPFSLAMNSATIPPQAQESCTPADQAHNTVPTTGNFPSSAPIDSDRASTGTVNTEQRHEQNIATCNSTEETSLNKNDTDSNTVTQNESATSEMNANTIKTTEEISSKAEEVKNDEQIMQATELNQGNQEQHKLSSQQNTIQKQDEVNQSKLKDECASEQISESTDNPFATAPSENDPFSNCSVQDDPFASIGANNAKQRQDNAETLNTDTPLSSTKAQEEVPQQETKSHDECDASQESGRGKKH